MKTILTLVLSFFLFGSLSAQEIVKNERDLKKELKKARRDSIANNDYQKLCNMVDSSAFVLEADYLVTQRGYRVQVSTDLNFIMIDSTYAVMQTGSNTAVGYNGMGGITVEGKVTSWKVTKDDKNKSLFIKMEVMSDMGVFSILIDVSSSGRASGRLTSLWPGQLTWDGYMVPLEPSKTFKGMPQ
jgi:hypothetical protein